MRFSKVFGFIYYMSMCVMLIVLIVLFIFSKNKLSLFAIIIILFVNTKDFIEFISKKKTVKNITNDFESYTTEVKDEDSNKNNHKIEENIIEE